MSNIGRRSVELPKTAVEALRRGDLIGAITAVRREQRVGFKEAKERVERYIAGQPALKKKMEKVVVNAQHTFTRWMIGFAFIAILVLLLVLWKHAT
jgi:predicted RND superfamily exporter protein